MNARGIIIDFNDNFIDKLADLLVNEYLLGDNDLSRIACVFGGKRPALFVNRAIARILNKPFLPPKIFSMDEYVRYMSHDNMNMRLASDLELTYIVYSIAQKKISGFIQENTSFSDFMPWAHEIVSFIEQLDLECIDNSRLSDIEKSAGIGFDVPESINKLLKNIGSLRTFYRARLKELGITTRGMLYSGQSFDNLADKLKDFDKIFFCGTFYLHKAETILIKNALDSGRAACVFHGAFQEWDVLKKVFKDLQIENIQSPHVTKDIKFSLYKGHDTHTQSAIVANIFNNEIKDKNDTVIVLPRAEAVTPLLMQIAPLLRKCNVSMGYPFKRTALYVLFDLIYRAQESRMENSVYYSKDFLSVLKHPLIKNTSFINIDSRITRILAHKIEETLIGRWESSISGSIFIDIRKIPQDPKIINEALGTLTGMGIDVTYPQLSETLSAINEFCFLRWQKLTSLFDLSNKLKDLMDMLVNKSIAATFPFAAKSIKKIYAVIEEFASVFFNNDSFQSLEVLSIFIKQLKNDVVPFIGSPLSGTQILGLFETRLLNFKNVILMDVNESYLPKLKITESLIPREVMLMLGLNRLEKEEEIQRYHFKRLLSGAENNYIVYSSDNVHERSRFIEELIWAKQLKEQSLKSFEVKDGVFISQVSFKDEQINKTSDIADYLMSQTYSASRIDTYLNCPMQFYFKYVLGLNEKEDVSEDIDAIGIGTFVHELLDKAFKQFIGKKPGIDAKFIKYFFKLFDDKFDNEIKKRTKSGAILLKNILTARFESFINAEKQSDTKEIIELENRRFASLDLNGMKVAFQYTIDRLEELSDGTLMVTDYKTGSVKKVPAKIESLQKMAFTREEIKKQIKSFQLPLYYHFINEVFPGKTVNAQLYSLRDMTKTCFIPLQETSSAEIKNEICRKALAAVFEELFNVKVPFVADREETKCAYCPFRQMCA
ncbi:MAG: PD-(D/E)XK nuclease family protein [Candidatus Omnitrophota bacterium]